jgi:hypothetical protein
MLVMPSRGTSARWITAALSWAVLAAASASFAADSKSKHTNEKGPGPSLRIDVAPLGYTPPSRFYLIARFAFASLDFIDKDHLLFTFREGGLLPRVPDDPRDDEDQAIHATVLDIHTGKIVREARWRMHDRQRYLWAIGGGQFLVRQRDALYFTDSNLELRPYLKLDAPLQAVAVSPNHKLMMVETDDYGIPDEKQPDPRLVAPPAVQIKKPSTRIVMVRLDDHKIIAQSRSRHTVELPLLGNSFLETYEGDRPDQWIIRNKPFVGEPTVITKLKSACDPAVETLSDSVALASACPGGSSDHLVSAFSLNGTLLWQDLWRNRYIWPTFEYAENGSRFAFGSLEMSHSIGALDPFSEDDVNAQMVGVYQTDTGKLDLVRAASPVLSSGHNYALSADGTAFAILREGAIEIYDLPPVAPAPSLAKASPK